MIHNWIHGIQCLLENNENRKVAASLANPYFHLHCCICLHLYIMKGHYWTHWYKITLYLVTLK